MPIELKELYFSSKSLAFVAKWAVRDQQALALVVPLDIGGVTVEGLRLRVTARTALVDEVVACQLEYIPPVGRGGSLCRYEWRPLRAHNNKGIGPKEWQYRSISGTHVHGFEINWQYAADQVRRGNLPVAIPRTVDPTRFQDILADVGKEFRITGLEKVEIPPWKPVIL